MNISPIIVQKWSNAPKFICLLGGYVNWSPAGSWHFLFIIVYLFLRETVRKILFVNIWLFHLGCYRFASPTDTKRNFVRIWGLHVQRPQTNSEPKLLVPRRFRVNSLRHSLTRGPSFRPLLWLQHFWNRSSKQRWVFSFFFGARTFGTSMIEQDVWYFDDFVLIPALLTWNT